MSVNDSFLDTNILVYAVDTIDMEKHKKAQSLVAKLIENGQAVISAQVLQEFYNVATKKLHVSKEKTLKIVESFNFVYTIPTTPQLIIKAIKLSISHQFSIWDSLVLTAAKDAGCDFIYSEDLNDGQIVDGVKIINPFK